MTPQTTLAYGYILDPEHVRTLVAPGGFTDLVEGIHDHLARTASALNVIPDLPTDRAYNEVVRLLGVEAYLWQWDRGQDLVLIAPSWTRVTGTGLNRLAFPQVSGHDSDNLVRAMKMLGVECTSAPTWLLLVDAS